MPFFKSLRKQSNRVLSRSQDAAKRSGEYLDAAISLFAPRIGAKRSAYRAVQKLHERQIERFARHWETGDDTVRAGKWLGSRLSPDSALEEDLDELREKSDELYRTFAYANGAIENRTDNVVGSGFRPQARIQPVEGFISEAEATKFNTELEALFKRVDSVIGPSGLLSTWEIERQAERCWKREGEAIVIFSDVGRAQKPIPLQIQCVDSRRLETPSKYAGDKRVRLGIKRDARGEILGYYIRDSHPQDTVDFNETHEFYEIDRVCHIYDQLYPDQSRGLPWFAAVLNEIKDFKDFREATIISAQVAACVSLVIATENPELAKTGTQNAAGNTELGPGKVIYTGLADSIQSVTPNQPGTTYGMFSEWNLLAIAGGLNWPFGWLVKDRRKSSFAAGKLEEIDGGVSIRCDQQKLRDRFLIRFWNRLVTEAVIVGECSISPTKFNEKPWLFCEHVWTAPGRPWIDGTKEVQAAVTAKNENILPMAEIHGKLGLDTQEVFTQREKERRDEEKRDIVPPDVVSSQPLDPGEEDDDDEEDDVVGDVETRSKEKVAA